MRNGELPELMSLNPMDPVNPNYEQAEFKPVIRTVNALGHLGLQAKTVLDDAIDKCNVLVDLRRVMNRCRMAANGADTDAAAAARKQDAPATIARRGLHCLERYCWLLLFTAYCIEQAWPAIIHASMPTSFNIMPLDMVTLPQRMPGIATPAWSSRLTRLSLEPVRLIPTSESLISTSSI